MWSKVVLHKEGFPITVYVNADDTRCVTFPLFGKYFQFSSDTSALDLCVQVTFHVSSDWNPVPRISTYAQYENSQEDTAILPMAA